MTTLAGSKIRRYREAQSPKLTRAAFGARYGVKIGTLQGLEDEDKRPRDPALVNRLAADGICDHADWYLPAHCPRCAVASDDPIVRLCAADRCPLAVRKVA